ncbi:MAG: HAD family hydrolase, partial [Acholeplasmatales bacterium]|nr:HAD family hydrolase [Acholeplasmatales bacterium]
KVKAKRIEALANDKKAKILNVILGKKNPNKLNVKKACYVGDTLNDMLAAKAANIKTVAVLYKDNPEEMIEADPDYAISTPQELLKICVE